MKYPAEQHSTFFLNFQSEKWIEGIILVSLKPKNITKTVYAQIICAEGDRGRAGDVRDASRSIGAAAAAENHLWWSLVEMTGLEGRDGSTRVSQLFQLISSKCYLHSAKSQQQCEGADLQH